MRRIVTIGREFGSGGRELGKRLSDHLGFAYYDREIITAIAQRSKLHENYVANTLEHGWHHHVPLTFGRTLVHPVYYQENMIKLLSAQQTIIQELAELEDCVIVGRSADAILSEYNPFRIFVYADTASKIRRCRERAPQGEALSDREMKKQLARIDAGRAKSHAYFGTHKWGDKKSYQLCVNTTGIVIKNIVPSVAEYVNHWFEVTGSL